MYLSLSFLYYSEFKTISCIPYWKLLICLTKHSLATFVAFKCDYKLNFYYFNDLI